MKPGAARYFGGNAADMGKVVALPQTTFAAFVKEVLGHPAIINLTRAEYLAAPKHERDKAKRVPFFTAATFQSATDRRITERSAPANLIILDIDDPVQARPFIATPSLLENALEPLAFAAYTTASSTPEDPRMRIVVSAEGIKAEDYPAAVEFIGHQIGLPSTTRESRVFVQLMYVPTMFRDDDPVEHHPLVVAVQEGTAFTPSVLKQQSLDKLYGAEPPPPDKLSLNAEEADAIADTLEFLRAPLDDITLQDVVGALDHIDPDVGYSDWLSVAAALKHQFPRSEDAYMVFDLWSAGGKKYVGPADTRAKWESLRSHPRGRAPITIRSLFFKAAEAGWEKAKEISYAAFHKVLVWMSDPNRTVNDLMLEGVKRISSAPLLGPIEQSTLISRLQESLKTRSLKVSRVALDKELRLRLKTIKSQNSSSQVPENKLPPWARGICYVAATNQFYRRTTNQAFSPEVADNLFNVHLMDEDSQTTGRPAIKARDFLLNLVKIPRVDHFRYDPVHPEQVFITEGSRRYVNIYIPTYPEPDPATAEAAGEIFHRHVSKLLDNERHQHLLIDFLAYNVQCPGEKINWAVLLQGTQGCGKTALADAMRCVLGDCNVKSVEAGVLLSSSFNDWATGAQLVAMEEVRVVGHSRWEVMNKLKPVISNSRVSIHKKFRDVEDTINVTNYLMFTNHHDALAITDGDRRYFVLSSVMQAPSDVYRLGRDYFDRFYNMLQDKAAGLRQWFLDWKLSDGFHPKGHAPRTEYALDLMRATASPMQAAIQDAISDRESALVQVDLISARELRNILDLQRVGVITDQGITNILRDLGYLNYGRIRLGEDRHSIWVHRNHVANIHDLEEAREIAKTRFDSGKIEDGIELL